MDTQLVTEHRGRRSSSTPASTDHVLRRSSSQRIVAGLVRSPGTRVCIGHEASPAWTYRIECALISATED